MSEVDFIKSMQDDSVVAAFIEANSKNVSSAIKISCHIDSPAVDFVLARVLSGESLMGVAEDVGFPYALAATAIWKTLGLRVGTLHAAATIRWRNSAVKRVIDGESLTVVAKDYGVSKQALSVWIRDAGYESSPVILRRVNIRNQIIEKLRNGATKADIAKELSVSRSAIMTAARVAGIVLPRAKRMKDPAREEAYHNALPFILEGARVKDIAETYSIPYNCALQWCRRAGRAPLPKKKATHAK